MAIPGARRREGSGDGTSAFWPPPRDAWIATAGLAVIFGGHLFYGALRNDAALSMNFLAALLLGSALLSRRLRADLLRLKGLVWPATLFALTILVALWTLTPWTPGGPHPVWAYVGLDPGAATIDRSSTIMETIKLLGLGCFFVLGLTAGSRDDRARFAVQAFIASGAVFGIWAMLGAVTGNITQSTHRLEGHFLNANTAGTFFASLLVPAIAEVATQLRSRRTSRGVLLPLSVAAALTIGVCLLDTASRGATLAALSALLFFWTVRLAAGKIKASPSIVASIALAATAIAGLLLAGDELFERYLHTGDALEIRAHVFRVHWESFKSSPLLGYGLGSLDTVNKILLDQSNYLDLWNIRGILNVYLQWLEQMGIVGSAFMFATIGSIMVSTMKGYWSRSRMTGLVAALLASDVAILVHGAMDFGLEVFSIAAMWAWLLGLQFAVAQGSSQR